MVSPLQTLHELFAAMDATLVALLAEQAAPGEDALALLADCVDNIPEQYLPQLSAFLDAVAGDRGPGSVLAAEHPLLLDDVFLVAGEDRGRSFSFVFQDKDDCTLVKGRLRQKSFAGFDTVYGTIVKDSLFLHGLGWGVAASESFLLDDRCYFDDMVDQKLRETDVTILKQNMAAYFTRAVRRARAAAASKPPREHREIGFGVAMYNALTTAAGGSIDITTAAKGAAHPSRLLAFNHATITGQTHVMVQVVDDQDAPVASFGMSSWIHTSALHGVHQTLLDIYGGHYLRTAMLQDATKVVKLKLKPGANLETDHDYFF